jgi:para-nitrobenzyl esterase
MLNNADESESTSLDRRSFIVSALAAGTLATGVATNAIAQVQNNPGPVASDSSIPSPVVETTAGDIRGSQRGRIFSFKGVPYAATTAGIGRFQPPSGHPGWTGVREALQIGLRCPVPQSTAQAEFVVMDRREPAGEDCLCLNVWTAGLNDGGNRPVMLWLHGGGFRGGSAGHTCYDGTRLADTHDVVVVGVNHRVNVWGYLFLAGLGDPAFENASNVGMLDIVASLAWVRDNIRNFGGNPDNVTVFGQSGGGSKVSTLLGMPAAQGLFHRAIAMSGSQVRSITPDQASETAERFLGALKINPRDATRVLDVPYYEIREASERGQFNWGPVMDGKTIPQHIFDPVATPISSNVPLMIGTMETEATWTVSQHYDELDDKTLLSFTSALLGKEEVQARKVIATYKAGRPQASNLDLYLILASDLSGFRTGTNTQAERKSLQNAAPVYKYYFDWYSPVANGHLRAMHTMDIPFFFNDVITSKSLIGDGPELQGMAELISAAVTTFARNGNPNRSGLPYWAPFDTESRATMFLNPQMKLISDPYRDERLVLEEVLG